MDSRQSTRSYSSSQFTDEPHPSTRPQPLTYRELAKGALYNAAQPSRHERTPLASQSMEHLRLDNSPHDSVADLAAGHLYNPTSSVHEVDPPTWPGHGMENVPASKSPFKSYRMERPPSPPLAKKYNGVYQGRRPAHHVVASGALYNPYVKTRLPDDLQPPEEVKLQRQSTIKTTVIHEPAPRAPVRIPEARSRSDLSVTKNGTVDRTHTFPAGSRRSSVHAPNTGLSREPSVQPNHSRASSPHRHGAPANPNMGTFAHATSRTRTISDDTMYYHPSREGSIHMVPAPGHSRMMEGYPESMHHSRVPSRAPTAGGGSINAFPSRPPSTLVRPAPWMQQETVNPSAFSSVHPSRAHSPINEATYFQHSREASIRGPSSLHHELPNQTSSHHPSRAPSFVGPPVLEYDFAAPAGNHHPSRAPSVRAPSHQENISPPRSHHPSRVPSMRDPSLHHDISVPPGSHHPSRAPSVNGGGSMHIGDVPSRHLSQMPSVIRDSVFQDEELFHEDDIFQEDTWGAGGQAWGQSGGAGWPAADFEGGGSLGPDHPLSHRLSSSSTLRGGTLKGATSTQSFHPSRAPSAAATHVSRFQEQNGSLHRVPSRAPSRMSQIQHHVGGSRAGTPAFVLPAVYDALPEEDVLGVGTEYPHADAGQQRAVSPGVASFHGSRAASLRSVHNPAPSAHPSRAPSVHTVQNAAASAHPSRAPSVAPHDPTVPSHAPSVAGEAALAPSRAPSVMGIPRAPSAAPTLTRRGKTSSKLGRGGGRATPAPAAVDDRDSIHISVVQPTD